MNKQIAVMINKYAKMLTQIDDSQLAKYKVLVRVDGVFYETEGDLAGAFTIRENAGDRLRQIYPVEGSILMGGSEVCAIVLSNTRYCRQAAQGQKPLRASLDDMAQVIGPKVEVLPYEEPQIKAALQHAAGCFVKDRYTICTGRSLFEAVTAGFGKTGRSRTQSPGTRRCGPCFRRRGGFHAGELSAELF